MDALRLCEFAESDLPGFGFLYTCVNCGQAIECGSDYSQKKPGEKLRISSSPCGARAGKRSRLRAIGKPDDIPFPWSPGQSALVTINIGNSLSKMARESMVAAANRWGVAFVELRQPIEYVGGLPHWQKAFLNRYAERVQLSRVAYFDADTIIRDDAPSPFEIVPADRVGVVSDCDHFGPGRNEKTWREDRTAWEIWSGAEIPFREHVNGGVIVFTVGESGHRQIFEDWIECGESRDFGRAHRLVDEVALSLVLRSHGAAYWMQATWNIYAPHMPPGPMRKFVYHYAGPGAKPFIGKHSWQTKPPASLAPAVSSGPLPITATILHWRRPENVAHIVSALRSVVSEIIVVPAPGALPLPPLPGATVREWPENTLYRRFYVAAEAKNECVLVIDDDLLPSADTIRRLFAEWQREPDRVHGIFGRKPKRVPVAGGGYVDEYSHRPPHGINDKPEGRIGADVHMVLTRVLLMRRDLATRTIEALPFFEELQQDSKPHGNGEDIILSFVARRHSRKLNRAHALPSTELRAPDAICDWSGHRAHRTAVMQRCYEWLRAERAIEAEGDFYNCFDRVYCINLDRRPERWTEFSAGLPVDWPFRQPERFAAVDGQAVTPPDWYVYNVGSNRNGGWGCLSSHRSILERCRDEAAESVLILEDDAVFDRDFSSRAREFLASVPPDWEMIYFGGHHKKPARKMAADPLAATFVTGTHAYALRGKGIAKALAQASGIGKAFMPQIDHRWGQMIEAGKIIAFCPPQWIVGQRDGYSDITGGNRDLAYTRQGITA